MLAYVTFWKQLSFGKEKGDKKEEKNGGEEEGRKKKNHAPLHLEILEEKDSHKWVFSLCAHSWAYLER
jgi:hypothetical protein